MSEEPTKKKEPVVNLGNEVTKGGKAKHDNGETYEVVDILPEGVRLLGVANLVHPSVLKPA